jgi:hypothetical protein
LGEEGREGNLSQCVKSIKSICAPKEKKKKVGRELRRRV